LLHHINLAKVLAPTKIILKFNMRLKNLRIRSVFYNNLFNTWFFISLISNSFDSRVLSLNYWNFLRSDRFNPSTNFIPLNMGLFWISKRWRFRFFFRRWYKPHTFLKNRKSKGFWPFFAHWISVSKFTILKSSSVVRHLHLVFHQEKCARFKLV